MKSESRGAIVKEWERMRAQKAEALLGAEKRNATKTKPNKAKTEVVEAMRKVEVPKAEAGKTKTTLALGKQATKPEVHIPRVQSRQVTAASKRMEKELEGIIENNAKQQPEKKTDARLHAKPEQRTQIVDMPKKPAARGKSGSQAQSDADDMSDAEAVAVKRQK